MKRRFYTFIARLCAALLFGSCNGVGTGLGGGGASAKIIDHSNYDPSSFSDAQIAAVAKLRVYFEHASVGANVCSGIDTLSTSIKRYTSGRISWTSAYDAAWWATNSGLADNNRGNPSADEKISLFTADMTAPMAAALDVAMYKFCFIDSPDSATALFATAKSAMEALEAKYPEVAFVWWTMPIQTSSNEQRQAYNDLVRSYCKTSNKWLMDIADIESHEDSGDAVIDDSGYELLSSAYSSDGGHINPAGELKLAKAYWRLIAEIASAR